MDCRGISDTDRDYMLHWLREEGNSAMVNHLATEDIDIRKHPVEFGTYATTPMGMIPINHKSETSVPGLYAAGDDAIPTISPAATFGWIAGENAAAYAAHTDHIESDATSDIIEKLQSRIKQLTARTVGPDWKEVNIALQQVMQDYAGRTRSGTLLTGGLQHLRRIQKKANADMLARNQHEITRCLEVLNLLELGELVFVASLERKETRGVYARSDYPFANPLMELPLIVKNSNGGPHVEWRMPAV
jgi:succinate dehydrogenase/fumarate reductase flavoprotein subunit